MLLQRGINHKHRIKPTIDRVYRSYGLKHHNNEIYEQYRLCMFPGILPEFTICIQDKCKHKWESDYKDCSQDVYFI